MAKITTLTSEKSKFVFYSLRERLAIYELAKHLKWNLHEVSDHDGFDRYDVIYTNEKSLRCVGEVKIRRHYSTEFQDKGWVFEKKKYDQLINNEVGLLISHLKLRPIYILFLYDKIAIWDVSKINPNDFKSEVLRHESVGGEDNLVDKDVIYLHLKDATIIDYELDYNKLSYNTQIVFGALYPNNKKDVINL